MNKRGFIFIIKIFSLFLFLIAICLSKSTFSADKYYEERPILLGTSGGNLNDSSKKFCCSGTLGALVQDRFGRFYILSNNHVLARTNLGIPGEYIIQPGLIDQDPVCYADTFDKVAILSKFIPINFQKKSTNLVDAAIAFIEEGKVDPQGRIRDIGQIGRCIVEPVLNLPVKKRGRTTGLTFGYISGINVSVDVIYTEGCGGRSQKARFINQIMIKPGTFSAGGDSGSLIVVDCSPYPCAVGLLFAGSYTVTVANPIGEVLSSLGVNLVGTTENWCSLNFGGLTQYMKNESAKTQLSSRVDLRAIEKVRKVKERHEEALLQIDGVVGVGVGLSEIKTNQAVIQVYTKKSIHEMKKLLPQALDGVPIEIVYTGEIIAY